MLWPKAVPEAKLWPKAQDGKFFICFYSPSQNQLSLGNKLVLSYLLLLVTAQQFVELTLPQK
jgi:hypothetical protein